MNIPFNPSEIASDAFFAGREKEVETLTENILSGKNTIILSHIKEGKSSLFARAISLLSDKDVDFKVCRMSSAGIVDEADFCRILVQQTVFSLSSGVEESMRFLNRSFPLSDPRIVVGNDGALRLEADFSRCSRAQLFRTFDVVASYAEDKGVKLCLAVKANIYAFSNLIFVIGHIDRANWVFELLRNYHRCNTRTLNWCAWFRSYRS